MKTVGTCESQRSGPGRGARPAAVVAGVRLAVLLMVGLLFMPVAAHAGRVSLAWDPNPEPFVAGYVVWYGTSPGVYTNSIDVGSTTSYVLPGLTNGVTYYFAVRAYSFDLLYSQLSNVIGGVPANLPPSIMNPGSLSMVNGPLTLLVSGSDPDFDTLSYSAAGLPPGLTIDSSTGVIGGNVPIGVHVVTVTASDGAAQASTTFTIASTPNASPSLVNQGNRSDPEGAVVSLLLQGSDVNGDLLTYSASGLPPGLTLNPASGLISGTLSYTAAGAYATIVGVSDGQTTTSIALTWTVTNTNRAPVLTNPGALGSLQGLGVFVTLVASDPDGDPLVWSAQNLPAGLAINATSGVISGTPTALGNFAAVATASDGTVIAQVSFAWSVASPLPGQASPATPSGSIVTATPTFSWAAVASAAYYLLSIDDASATSPTRAWYTPTQAGCASGIGTCAVAAPSPLTSGPMNWMVLTWNLHGYGPWSATLNALVDLADASVPASSPSAPSGPIGTRTPTYSWNAVGGAIWYQVSATDAAGTVREFWYESADVCLSSLCGATPDTVMAIGPAQWRVRVWRVSGGGAWSSPLSFETADASPGKALLLAPAGAVLSSTPTFSWNAVIGTSYYLLRVTDRDNVSSDRWYRPSAVGCPLGTGTCAVSPGASIKAGRTTWQVLTWNGPGYGPWSDLQEFSVDIADPAAAVPQPLTPTNAIATSNATYTWTAVGSALSYRLSIHNDGGAAQWWFSPAAAGCSAAAVCGAAPPAGLQNGTADWQVQAWTANGYSVWSAAVPLTVSIPAPPTPTLVSPANASVASPAFVWNASNDATSYYIRVIDSTGLRVNRWLTPLEADCASGSGSCTFNAGVALSSGDGTWQVLAWNLSGYSPWSSPFGFTVP